MPDIITTSWPSRRIQTYDVHHIGISDDCLGAVWGRPLHSPQLQCYFEIIFNFERVLLATSCNTSAWTVGFFDCRIVPSVSDGTGFYIICGVQFLSGLGKHEKFVTRSPPQARELSWSATTTSQQFRLEEHNLSNTSQSPF